MLNYFLDIKLIIYDISLDRCFTLSSIYAYQPAENINNIRLGRDGERLLN